MTGSPIPTSSDRPMIDRLVEAVTRNEAWSSFWSEDEAKALIRAVLRELREPTAAMVDAGMGPTLLRVTERWQAMIDAVLTEPRP